jgi:hypothetical protein
VLSYSPRFVSRLKCILRRGLTLWPEIAIMTAVVVAFGPTLAGTAHLPYDAEFYHYPLLRLVQEQLASGTVPAWDEFSYGGIPLLANAQSAWLYPPQLILDGILAVVRAPLTEHALDVLAILHVAVAGLATAAVARGRRLGRAGAAFAGIFVVLNGETVAQAQHVLMTETFAWVPLAILVIDRMREGGITARRIVALGALFAMMITAGFLPLVTACAALLVGVGLAQGPRRLRTQKGVVSGMALGVAMAGAMIVPIVAMLGVLPPLEVHGSLPTTGLVTTIFPNAFGQWQASLAEFTGSNLTNSYFYLGAGVLVLLPLALTSGRRVLGDAVLVLVLLLASFGTPGADIAKAIQSLPTIGFLWRPEDVAYVATVPLALLLARGLSRAPSTRQLAASALSVLVVGIVTFTGSHGHAMHLLANAPRRTLLALLLVMASVCAASFFHARLHDGKAVALALGLAALVAGADLASAVTHRYFVNTQGPATSAGPNAIGDGSMVLSVLRRRLAPSARIDADVNILPAMWEGFSPVWHLADVNGFQPQFSKYQLARVMATGVAVEVNNRIFPLVPAIHPFLEEMDVEYVVALGASDRLAGAPDYTLVFQDGRYHVYRVDAQESRAYAINEGCLRRHGAFDLLACRTGPAVRTRVTGWSTRRLVIESTANSPLLLITGEPWYPGWRAMSPSGPLPVRRIGYLAAVSVPQGTTQVQLSYHAPGLLVGGGLSTLAIGSSLLFLAYQRRSWKLSRSR